jgi:hypothetical protein
LRDGGPPTSPKHDRRGHGDFGEDVKENRVDNHKLPVSAIGRIEFDVLGEFALPAIAIGEETLLVAVKLLARLGRVFEIRPFDDGVDRAGFLAQSAVDAFDPVDVIAGGAARAVVAPRTGFDGDRLRRTDRLAELAGDAALFAVRITPQRMLAAEARRDRFLSNG